MNCFPFIIIFLIIFTLINNKSYENYNNSKRSFNQLISQNHYKSPNSSYQIGNGIIGDYRGSYKNFYPFTHTNGHTYYEIPFYKGFHFSNSMKKPHRTYNMYNSYPFYYYNYPFGRDVNYYPYSYYYLYDPYDKTLSN